MAKNVFSQNKYLTTFLELAGLSMPLDCEYDSLGAFEI